MPATPSPSCCPHMPCDCLPVSAMDDACKGSRPETEGVYKLAGRPEQSTDRQDQSITRLKEIDDRREEGAGRGEGAEDPLMGLLGGNAKESYVVVVDDDDDAVVSAAPLLHGYLAQLTTIGF
ncbi:hypothetical protein ABZP36_007104 [Zizania latifolia]